MVKETRFDKHPVRLEKGLFLGEEQEDVCGIQLDFANSVLTSASNSNTTPWDLMDIATLAVSAEKTVPKNAIGVILHVVVNDAASAAGAYAMAFATAGIILASKAQYIYPGDVNDRKKSALVIVELNEDDRIAYKITASGAAFDYSINLIGWVIGGTRLSKVTMPSVDLKCKFSVNQ